MAVNESLYPTASTDEIHLHRRARSKSPSSLTDSDADDEEPSLQPLQRLATLSKSYAADEEAAVLRRLDSHLVLFLAFLYLLSFLDRSNIGNARIANLEKSLSMTPRQYDLCLLVFYLTYITFEWMILLYRLIPPHIYISLCVLSWGIVASLQSVVTSFRQLLVLRALLGVTEAAFGPGVPFYMTFFYRREELAYRVGLQISAAPLATSFASSLAWVIMQVAKKIGLEQWRALFLVEGFPSIITAVWAWYWIPDGPGNARWLTARERKVAVLRIQSEAKDDISALTASRVLDDKIGGSKQQQHHHRQEGSGFRSRIDLNEIKTTLLDPKAYMTSFMFLSVNVSFASLPVFLPTIINSMSFSPLTSQLLSAPPYLVSFFFVLLVGRISDKIPNSRSICLCTVASLSAVSYTTIALAGFFHETLGDKLSIAIRYIAIYPAAMGLFSSVVLIITWTLNNQASTTGKGVGMILLNVIGQCGPLIGVELFPRSDGPLYVNGMGVCAGFMCVVAGLAWALRRYLIRLNANIGITNDGKGAYEMVGLVSGSTPASSSHAAGGSGGGSGNADGDGDDDEDEIEDEGTGFVGGPASSSSSTAAAATAAFTPVRKVDGGRFVYML